MRLAWSAWIPSPHGLRQLAPGIAIAAVLAVLAKAVAGEISDGIAGGPAIPLSPVLCAVLFGMLWRNTIGVPAWSEQGLTWTMQALLRTGIALVGLRLTLAGATSIAAIALPIVVACISIAIVAGLVISRFMRVPRRLATLLALGTAVCGCTAVIALSPAIRARSVDTAFAVTCVVLFGCVAMLFYPWIAHHFFLTAPVYAGIFLGTSIHDTSQVIGSALIYSQQVNQPEALAAASVAKLLRNLSIAVLIPTAAWLARDTKFFGDDNAEGSDAGPQSPAARALPFFVIGFIVLIVVRTLGDATFTGATAAAWHEVVSIGQASSELFLICGMTAVGLSVSFNQMWRIGWRPLAAGFLIATTVGGASLLLTLATLRFMH